MTRWWMDDVSLTRIRLFKHKLEPDIKSSVGGIGNIFTILAFEGYYKIWRRPQHE